MFKNSLIKTLIGLITFSTIIIGKTYGYEEVINIYGLSGVWGGTTIEGDTEAHNRGEGLLRALQSNTYNGEDIKSIQSFTQTRKNLNLYLIDENGNINNYTLMDRNMGATEVYNKQFDFWENYNEEILDPERILSSTPVNRESFGYQYQRGNNYGFTPCTTSGCNDFPGEGDILSPEIHKLYYVIRGGFTKGNFANNVWNRGTQYIIDVENSHTFELDCPNLQYYPKSHMVRNRLSDNLWGGFGDSAISNGNSIVNWYGFDDGKNYHCSYPSIGDVGVTTGDTILDSRTSSRKGPCPNGYHVPSFSEWNKIVDERKIARNRTEIGDKTVENIQNYYNNSWGAKLASDLLLPPAGARATDGSEYHQGIVGRYRSSSPTYYGSNLGLVRDYVGLSSRYLAFNQLGLYGYTSSTQCAGSCLGYNYDFNSRTSGLPIRCIKDTPTSNPDELIRIYPNGGANAIVTIDGNRVSTLSSPTRDGCSFKGRYSNDNKVNEGDEISNDLYAKWEGSNCEDITTRESDCTGLPENAQWINGKFTQNWDGLSRTPTSHENTYSSNNSVECSFQCNTNYTRDSNSNTCITNTQKSDCNGLPNNAQWINGKFTQTWDGTSRIPSSHENTYTTDNSIECSFQCSTNYSRNSSSKSCEYNGSSGGGGGGGGSGGSGGGGSSSKNNYIDLSTNRESPSTSQYINLTIETDEDYTGKIKFSKFQYRSSSSSSWSNISRTSSTYVSDYSSPWSNGYYKMTSSDDGYITLKNLIKFKKAGYYKICIEDIDYNSDCIQINVGTSSSSNNYNLSISASPSNPDTYEWVKLTITTDDDYTGKINFSKFQYKSSSSSSWSTISSRTSSTYVSDYSSEWSNGYYRMTSSDDGYVTLKNLVKFKKSGYYRIYVEDTDGNESYVQINVDTSSSSSSSNDDLTVKASPSSPDTYEWVKLTITTDDDYTGKINFSKFQYKSSSSSSWSTISSRTSSTYVSDYSSAWSNGYYKMTSSDDGEAIFKNLVKFKKSGYYRIYVEDTDGNESYVQINVDSLEKGNNKENDDNNGEDIEDLINRLINGDTNSNGNSQSNTNQSTNESNQNYNTNQNYNNSLNETYISRSCKPYTIEYIQSLNAYTSPELKKKEYFINIDYFKRYIDSKNAQNIECPSNGLRISTPYTDTYTGDDHVVAPNGKIYFITQQNGEYTSTQLNTAKRFSDVNELKNHIKKQNPLIKIN